MRTNSVVYKDELVIEFEIELVVLETELELSSELEHAHLLDDVDIIEYIFSSLLNNY